MSRFHGEGAWSMSRTPWLQDRRMQKFHDPMSIRSSTDQGWHQLPVRLVRGRPCDGEVMIGSSEAPITPCTPTRPKPTSRLGSIFLEGGLSLSIRAASRYCDARRASGGAATGCTDCFPRGPNPTFPTGGGRAGKRPVKCRSRAKGLHYMACCGDGASWPAAVIRGGGCGGRLRLRCATKSFWSVFNSV